jgi:hypothetical protein
MCLIVMLFASIGSQAQLIPPTTQPTTKPVNLSFIPVPPKVTPLAGTNFKPRIMFDYNFTPFYPRNDKWVDDGKRTEPDVNGRYMWEQAPEVAEYLLRCGFTPTLMAYNGTFNRADTWWDFEKDDWEAGVYPALNRFGVVWTNKDGTPREGNYSDPVDPRAAHAIAALAKTPWRFGATGVRANRPIFIDIEGTNSYNLNSYTTPTPEQAVQQVKNYIKMADAFRSHHKYAAGELYNYGGNLMQWYSYLSVEAWEQKIKDAPGPMEVARLRAELDAVKEFLKLEQDHAKRYNGYVALLYNWDIHAETDGESWFHSVDMNDGTVERYYPYWRNSKIATVIPTWEIYWPHNSVVGDKLRDMAGKPIPLDLWKKQIDYLVARGWHIYVWIPYNDVKPYKAHLDYLLRFK